MLQDAQIHLADEFLFVVAFSPTWESRIPALKARRSCGAADRIEPRALGEGNGAGREREERCRGGIRANNAYRVAISRDKSRHQHINGPGPGGIIWMCRRTVILRGWHRQIGLRSFASPPRTYNAAESIRSIPPKNALAGLNGGTSRAREMTRTRRGLLSPRARISIPDFAA